MSTMNPKQIGIISIILFAMLIAGFFFSRSQTPAVLISPVETLEKSESDSNVVLLDVRTQSEWDEGHIKNALFIPVQELEARVAELEPYKGKTIIAYCRSGNRSGVAQQILGKYGYSVYNMEGGILRWKKESLPLVEDSAR